MARSTAGIGAAVRLGVVTAVLASDACSSPGPQGDAERGRMRFAEVGCNGCHLVEGVGGMIGPDLSGIASAPLREPDRWPSVEAYLRESILEPQAYLVPRYPPDMPPAERLGLSDQDIEDLVAHLLTLR